MRMALKKLRQKWKEIKETHFRTFSDTLAWIAFAYVVIYALLKVLGIINSPPSLDIGLIASVAYFLGKYAQKLDFLTKEAPFVRTDLSQLKGQIIEVDRKLDNHVLKGH